MNHSQERIPLKARFIEDPTNFDFVVETKTGMAMQSFVETQKSEDSIQEEFFEKLSEIQESPKRPNEKLKSFYERNSKQKSELIGSVLERANTVTL